MLPGPYRLLFALLAGLVLLSAAVSTLPLQDVDMSDRHFGLLSIANGHWSYWWHHILVILPVAFFSFDNRIRYAAKWKTVFRATLAPAVLYIGWDVWFTRLGVWQFDHAKTTGPYLGGLPAEEWIWFFAIPFACLFIYENLNYFHGRQVPKKFDRPISLMIGLGSLLTGILLYDQIYSFLAFTSAGLITLWDLLKFPDEDRTRYYLTWMWSLIPMFLFNGWLTGMLSSSPLVAYAPDSFSGIRLGTMPIEDIFFGYGYLFLIYRIYQQIVDKSRG